MAVHHLCQWGFWGKDVDESCGEADVSIRIDDDEEEEELSHETCGWFSVNSVDNEFSEMTSELELISDEDE